MTQPRTSPLATGIERAGNRKGRQDAQADASGQEADRGEGQFARMVKGVDLRSTGGNSAWVRAPQLTDFALGGIFRKDGNADA